jgi:hypothetical protein
MPSFPAVSTCSAGSAGTRGSGTPSGQRMISAAVADVVTSERSRIAKALAAN